MRTPSLYPTLAAFAAGHDGSQLGEMQAAMRKAPDGVGPICVAVATEKSLETRGVRLGPIRLAWFTLGPTDRQGTIGFLFFESALAARVLAGNY